MFFAYAYRSEPGRPTFSLTTHPKFPHAEKLLAEPWSRKQKLHPTLSNLFPEGALRELIAKSLKLQVDKEFHLFAHLGKDLPGALVAEPMEPGGRVSHGAP